MSDTFSRRALDALDFAVLVFSSGLENVLLRNLHADKLIGSELPEVLSDAIETYVESRREIGKQPPAMRVSLGEQAVYVRVVPAPGDPPVEIAIVREEVIRDVDMFRFLNERHGISRREYQVLTALRVGKTNRQIATELGLAEGTVGRHIHRLLERFDVPNRTHLVSRLEQILARRPHT